MFFYKILEGLPDPPEELINSVDLKRNPTKMELGIHNKRYLLNWPGDYPAGVNVRVKHEEFDKWVRDNITDDIVDAGVNYVVIDPDAPLPVSTGAHCDVIRKFTMLYLIDPGGDNVETIFWKEKGQDEIVRPPGTQVEDRNKLELLEKATLPKGKWCILHTQILHSIDNIYRPRVAFQISLNNLPTAWDIDTSLVRDFNNVNIEELYRIQKELNGEPIPSEIYKVMTR